MSTSASSGRRSVAPSRRKCHWRARATERVLIQPEPAPFQRPARRPPCRRARRRRNADRDDPSTPRRAPSSLHSGGVVLKPRCPGETADLSRRAPQRRCCATIRCRRLDPGRRTSDRGRKRTVADVHVYGVPPGSDRRQRQHDGDAGQPRSAMREPAGHAPWFAPGCESARRSAGVSRGCRFRLGPSPRPARDRRHVRVRQARTDLHHVRGGTGLPRRPAPAVRLRRRPPVSVSLR